MIRVDRSGVAHPVVLTGPKAKGAKEAERAAKSLARWIAENKDPAEWTFKFKIYSDDEVKLRLTELFHGKCAYCESRYATTQPMDVEHWRPKGRVEGDPGQPPIQPAYYWLAATWENLLPSCIDCNRRRWQEVGATGKPRRLGKQDQFPLEPGSVRASAPGLEVDERPLLIDPTADQPERYLRFSDEAVVEPTVGAGAEHLRARASIDVYALNRSGLVQSRKEHLRVIRLHFARIAAVAGVLERTRDQQIRMLMEELLLLDLRSLARMRRDTEPYAQQARQIIDRYMEDFLAGGSDAVRMPVQEPGRVA